MVKRKTKSKAARKAAPKKTLKKAPAVSAKETSAAAARPSKEARASVPHPYLLQVNLLDDGNYSASLVEIADLKAVAETREAAIAELDKKFKAFKTESEAKGEALPEASQKRVYPERLDVAVSQGLYRRLDLSSKQERVPLDQLVTELLSTGLAKREAKKEGRREEKREWKHRGDSRRGEKRPSNHNNNNRRHGRGGHGNYSSQGNSANHGNSASPGNSANHGNQGNRGNNRNPKRKGYQTNIQSSEGFLDYVRNLEKGRGGGGGGGWRK